MTATKKRAWPSRPLQVMLFVILLGAAAFQVFAPVQSPQARAEALYRDAWFQWAASGGKQGTGVAGVEAALKLSPGNPLYEQALVWMTPPERLPSLLKERALGPDARALATGIPIVKAARKGGPAYGAPDIAALDAFAAVDPKNPLPHYLKAQALARAGRVEEALAETRAGNALPRLRHIVPDVSEEVLNTSVTAILTADLFPVQARFRDLARHLSDAANLRLRQRKVDEAREILDATCRMGVQVAGAEPRLLISFLVGKAVYAIGWSGLEPLLKDFGPKESLERFRKMDRAFEQGQRDATTFLERSNGMKRIMALSLGTAFLAGLGAWSCCLLVAMLIGWLVWARLARRAGESQPAVAGWGEGWLARVCLATYGVAAAALAATALSMRVPEDGAPGTTVALIASGIVVPLVPALAALWQLRRRYREHSGVRIGLAGLLWKSTPGVRAWVHRRLSAALAYQVLFIAALFALAISLYKPLLGAHPWQLERMAVGSLSEESEIVTRTVAALRSALR